jgi:surfeit locus 1 family protein
LYRRVRVAGRWQPQAQIFIDNRIHQGQAGFEVITPLEIAGSDRVVLVDRGWIARSRDYPAPPAVATPQGDAEVSGVAVLPPRRYLELSQETVSGNVWQNLSLDRYAERMRMKLLPVVVRAEPPSNGLALAAERPDFGIARHREYALTWFSLAATVAALWLFFSFGRHPR